MLLCEDFVNLLFKPIRTIVETVSKVSTFLHSEVLIAFWLLPSYLDHY